MNKLAIKVENLTKTYNLGVINYGIFTEIYKVFLLELEEKKILTKKLDLAN